MTSQVVISSKTLGTQATLVRFRGCRMMVILILLGKSGYEELTIETEFGSMGMIDGDEG